MWLMHYSHPTRLRERKKKDPQQFLPSSKLKTAQKKYLQIWMATAYPISTTSALGIKVLQNMRAVPYRIQTVMVSIMMKTGARLLQVLQAITVARHLQEQKKKGPRRRIPCISLYTLNRVNLFYAQMPLIR